MSLSTLRSMPLVVLMACAPEPEVVPQAHAFHVIADGVGVEAAEVALFDAADLDTPLALGVTDARGVVRVEVDRLPEGADGWIVRVGAPDYHDTWLAGDFELENQGSLDIPVFDDGSWSEIAGQLGWEPDPTLGALAVTGAPAFDAIEPAGEVTGYLVSSEEVELGESWSTEVTESPLNEVVEAGLEPGDVDIAVEVDGGIFERTLPVRADALTLVFVN